ncbi:MAG: hypothetical protein JXA67_02600, partial [Micromonosporaceae bacterium]|nr:hypothetical protein [Micromonosporaceae bacterium]
LDLGHQTAGQPSDQRDPSSGQWNNHHRSANGNPEGTTGGEWSFLDAAGWQSAEAQRTPAEQPIQRPSGQRLIDVHA